VIFDRKLYREVVWSYELRRVLDTNFTFFKSQTHLPTKERRQARTDIYSISPLTANHSLSLRVIFDRKLYREVLWSFELKRVLDTNFTFFKSQIHLPTKERRQARTDMYSSSPLTANHSLSLRVIFDRKLYREVVWSYELRRVLDTNFTFFKSQIHLPTKERRQARTDIHRKKFELSILKF